MLAKWTRIQLPRRKLTTPRMGRELLMENARMNQDDAAKLAEENRRLKAENATLTETLRTAYALLEGRVASDCDFCGGEGGWTEGPNPQMTPVIHKEGCEFMLVIEALSGAGAVAEDE